MLSQSDVEQHIKQYGAKQLTAADNTGLFVNSSNYSKKTKALVIAQTKKWSKGHGNQKRRAGRSCEAR